VPFETPSQKRSSTACGGAFSDKWFDVARRCGKEAEALQVEWGQPILPEAVDARLATGQFDTVTLIHNETSTGVMNPLAEIAAVVRRYPDVILIVDTVSSFSVVPTPFDELGVDVMLTGSQKALALPPGLASSLFLSAPWNGPSNFPTAAITSTSTSSMRTTRRT